MGRDLPDHRWDAPRRGSQVLRAPTVTRKGLLGFGSARSVTSILALPVHEIVRRTYPRPVREGDEEAMAIGRAIDGALSQIGHEARLGRRCSIAATRILAETRLDEELESAGIDLLSVERERILLEIAAVVQAFRRSEIFGLERPRTRVILIGGQVGVYAQPDYWDGQHRFFEMKSYLAIPPPPDVALQLRLFQLAFPRFDGVLLCLNRHVRPVETRRLEVPAPTPEESVEALRLAYSLGKEYGETKVLEYVEGPFVPYAVPLSPA